MLLPHLIIAVALIGLFEQFSRVSKTQGSNGSATSTDWIWRIVRWLYGGYFIYTSVMIARTLWTSGKGVPQPTPEAKAFYDALHATGFLYPLMGVTFGMGGLALLLQRTAPLGIVFLAPSVSVIFLFHLMLTGNFVWGSEWALGLLLLAWHYRSAYMGLWNYKSPATSLSGSQIETARAL